MNETSFDPRAVSIVRQQPAYDPNIVQRNVTTAIRQLGVSWSDLVRSGDRVLLKPNFVCESHAQRPDEWEQIVTHGDVIAAVTRHVAEALQGVGTITIADGPQTDSNFQKIRDRTGLDTLITAMKHDCPRINSEILDLRREYWETVRGVVVKRHQLDTDPRGYTLVNLGRDSCFYGKSGSFYGADYDTAFTAQHHSGERHEYLLARTAMDADVFINLPKMKTHKKVGVTLSLKNLVGINGDKNYLPHFCIGTPDEGGDEFPSSTVNTKIQSRLIAMFKRAALLSGTATKIWAPLATTVGKAMFGPTSQVVRS